MQRPWSVRTQLLALVLAAVVPLSLLVAYFIFDQRDRARAETLKDTLAVARVISARIDDHIQNIDTLLGSVSVWLSADLRAVEANDARLRTLQSGLPGYFSSISVLAPDGSMLNSSTASRPERESLNFADRDYFQKAIAQRDLALGQPVISRTSGKWILVAARPLLAADGSVRAVVSTSTLLERFQELLVPTELPIGSLMTVLNEQGIVIARSIDPQKWVGTNLSKSPNFQRARVVREYGDETVASDGAMRLSGYTTPRLVPWVVYVGIPADVALGQAHEDLARFWALSLLIIGLVAGAAYFLARNITRPAEQVAAGVSEVIAGNAGFRFSPIGPAEIQKIAEQFNRLLDARELIEAALRASEAQYRQFVERSPDPMFAHSDGRIVLANVAMEALLGAAPGQLLGTTVFDIIAPADRERVKSRIASVVQGLAVPRVEVQFVRLDGSTVPVEAAATSIRHLGKPAVLVTARDITERKRGEAARREQLTELQRWFEATVGREERMMALKREVDELLARLGEAPRYVV